MALCQFDLQIIVLAELFTRGNLYFPCNLFVPLIYSGLRLIRSILNILIGFLFEVLHVRNDLINIFSN